MADGGCRFPTAAPPQPMRSPIHTLPALVVLAFALLGSCGQRTDYPSLLLQADSAIIQADYLRADCLLARYDGTQGDASQHACMYRQFLRMERKFVDDSLTENDYALTDSLCRYYASKGDKEKEAVALLMLGDLYRTAKDSQKALEHVLSAEDILSESTNLTFLGWVAQLKGDIFYDQLDHVECPRHYHKFYEYAVLTGDTPRIELAAHRMAFASMMNNEADSAIAFCLLAMKYARSTTNYHLVRETLCDLYIQLGEYEKARPMLTDSPIDYTNWAYYYYGLNKQDSAMVYFAKAMTVGNIYAQHWYLRSMADIEQSRGNFKKSIEYYEKLIKTDDSIKSKEKSEELKNVQARHTYHYIQKMHNEIDAQKKRNYRSMRLITSGAIVILCVVLWQWRLKNRRKDREILRERLLRKEREEQYRNSIEKLGENNKRIRQLEQQLVKAREVNDNKHIAQLQKDAETLTLENQHIEEKLKQKVIAKQTFQETALYKRIKIHGELNTNLTEEEWKQIEDYIDILSANFTSRLLALANLSQTELRICYLVKLDIQPVVMANLLCKSKSAISMARNRLYTKITGEKGTSKQFDDFIQSL